MRAKPNVFADGYARYVADYRAYARKRGFTSELNSWPFVRRSFIECWAEPGFDRFWMVWNPGISYFVYRLFLKLGGRKRWVMPTLLAFVINGFIHTLLVVPFIGHWSFSVIVAFTSFGILTVISRLCRSRLAQEKWPTLINVFVNVGLVAGSFDLGFRVNRLLGF